MADIKFIPGVHPTYKEQFDKITEAYIKGDMKPLDPKFCFCGTICENSNDWFISSCEIHKDYGVYTGPELVRMEKALLDTIDSEEYGDSEEEYEAVLFKGMCAAIDVLKQIHIEHGEIIDEVPAFTKRELKTPLTPNSSRRK